MSVLRQLGRFSTREQVRNWLGLGFAQASQDVDLGSLDDGESQTVSVSVPEASVGDFVMASFSSDLSGLTLTAWVPSGGTASVRFHNGTGATVNLDSGTVRVRVFKS